MRAFPPSELAEDTEIVDLDRAPLHRSLGVFWDIKRDLLIIKPDFEEKPFTRRGVLSFVNAIFDPLGVACPVVLRGKLIQRKVMSSKHDEESSNDKDKKAKKASWDKPGSVHSVDRSIQWIEEKKEKAKRKKIKNKKKKKYGRRGETSRERKRDRGEGEGGRQGERERRRKREKRKKTEKEKERKERDIEKEEVWERGKGRERKSENKGEKGGKIKSRKRGRDKKGGREVEREREIQIHILLYKQKSS
ncbi:Retrotransposon Pao [Trinorchestia longiramus]|nr:Retrotransposon Pao [Trinorchestia longiramus]